MDIHCPTCSRITGRIADEKIPPNRKGNVTCPLCRTKIPVYREEREAPLPPRAGEAVASPGAAPDSPMGQKPLFTGRAGEYFRIWIVNIFLTLITFGIYAAWAKVRTRRYFYAHTNLAGHPFDYLANPMAILKGNLLIAGGLILYNGSQFMSPRLSGAIALLFALGIPFLVYKSLRFYARSSSYRNIRFRFSGSLKEAYVTYFLLPLCIPFTLGLIYPYWAYRRKRYFFQHFSFGAAPNRFTGEASYFFSVYMKASLLGIAAVAVLGLISTLGFNSFFDLAISVAGQGEKNADAGMKLGLAIFLAYLLALAFFSGIQQYLHARLTNYCWSRTGAGAVRFSSTLEAKRLLWIRFTNILAIIISLGLLTPWAKVRRTRYILENVAIVAAAALDDFTAAAGTEEGAYGDAATDFLDFEIGL